MEPGILASLYSISSPWPDTSTLGVYATARGEEPYLGVSFNVFIRSAAEIISKCRVCQLSRITHLTETGVCWSPSEMKQLQKSIGK